MFLRKPAMLLFSAAILAVSLPASADRGDDDGNGQSGQTYYSREHRPHRSQQPGRQRQTGYISHARAASIAANRTRARVTDVDFTTWRGRRVYEVDLKAQRGDYEVIVDARNGRILSSKFDPDD